jgi:histidinol-phosphate aminotransferase
VEGRDAQGVKDALAKDHGIMVRHYQKKLLDGFIRISVGKPEHTDYLITALRSMV